MRSFMYGAIISSALLVIPAIGICIWAFLRCRKDREKLRILFIIAPPLLALVLLIGYANIYNAHTAIDPGEYAQITGICLDVDPIVQGQETGRGRGFGSNGNVMIVKIESDDFPLGYTKLQCSASVFHENPILPGRRYKITYSPASNTIISAKPATFIDSLFQK